MLLQIFRKPLLHLGVGVYVVLRMPDAVLLVGLGEQLEGLPFALKRLHKANSRAVGSSAIEFSVLDQKRDFHVFQEIDGGIPIVHLGILLGSVSRESGYEKNLAEPICVVV